MERSRNLEQNWLYYQKRNALQSEASSVVRWPVGQNSRTEGLSQKLMHSHVLSCTEEQQSRRRRGLKRMRGVSDGFLVSAAALSSARGRRGVKGGIFRTSALSK